MSANRFYVAEPGLAAGRELTLPEETSRQISRVLRMREGDEIALFNGSNLEWPAAITSMSAGRVTVRPGEPVDPHTEAALQVTVCQALVPTERMEFVVQKCTELGASRIVPLITERVQARDRNISENRLQRWRRIATEAAEQSGRTRVPEIDVPRSLRQWLETMSGPAIMLWEEEEGISLDDAVRESLRSEAGHVTVLIGPVGGLSGDEAQAARTAGALLAGAGPRILRAETAPVVALSALMYAAGELAPRRR